eukprot:gene5922-biopygen13417
MKECVGKERQRFLLFTTWAGTSLLFEGVTHSTGLEKENTLKGMLHRYKDILIQFMIAVGAMQLEVSPPLARLQRILISFCVDQSSNFPFKGLMLVCINSKNFVANLKRCLESIIESCATTIRAGCSTVESTQN